MINHNDLCKVGAVWLRSRTMRFNGENLTKVPSKYVLDRYVSRWAEKPDVIGYSYERVTLIEVKVSRSDFKADAKKWFRKEPEKGVGNLRYYLCPKDLIHPEEIPEKWGLLYYNEGKIEVVKKADKQQSCAEAELEIFLSFVNRYGVKSGIYTTEKLQTNKQ